VIASVDGLWDARDQIVAEEARSFHALYITKNEATSDPNVILASPRLFQKYVCARVSQVFGGPTRIGPPAVAAAMPAAPAAEAAAEKADPQ
jgi:hypothetical protein